jgi:SAM-dependent methyltransferase
MSAATPYLLDNARTQAAQRMQVLARLFDAATQRALSAIGIADGWNCLEVGGGGGSVAHWLAERVAPRGSVLCTDIDPRHMPAPAHGNLRVERHDITRDALPAARFDLIHARLVLIHIPERAAVIDRLVIALKPGGWLVIEDFDALSMLPDSSVNPYEVQLAANEAMRKYMNRGGNDARFGRSLYGRFRAAGLCDVAAEGRLLMFDRGNGGAELMRANFEQLGDELVAAGLITAEQLRADIEFLDSDAYAAPSPVMWTVAGRRRLIAAAHR